MNKQDKYSDEHINAYIDGELDNEERARLLFDEQQDTVLSQRINEARMLKEKVQLAYSDLPSANISKKPVQHFLLFRNNKSLVAGIALLLTTVTLIVTSIADNNNVLAARQLINNTPMLPVDKIAKTIGTHKKVVINISQYQADEFDATLENIDAVLQQHKNDSAFKIELVAHQAGLRALDEKTSHHVNQIAELAKRFDNLNIVACAKSMADLATAGEPIKLMKSILTTPSAAEEVAKLTSQGWMYIKL